MIAALVCALPLLELFLVPSTDVRRVSFRDRLTPSLAGYKSGARALLRTELSIFPLGHSELPGVSDVGFFGSYARSLQSQTLTSDGSLAFTTQEIAWDAGARYRGIVGGEERFGASLSYGSLRNDFSGPRLPGVMLPAGTVQYWRPGASGRVAPALANAGNDEVADTTATRPTGVSANAGARAAARSAPMPAWGRPAASSASIVHRSPP